METAPEMFSVKRPETSSQRLIVMSAVQVGSYGCNVSLEMVSSISTFELWKGPDSPVEC